LNLGKATQAVQLSLRAAFGASLSLAIAEFLALEYPIYAFIAAVITTDLTPSLSRQLGVRRIVATVVGAIVGATLSPWLPTSVWSIGAGILLAMQVCHFFDTGDGAKIAGYICGIIMINHNVEPWSYAWFRFIETVLGVAVAWSISYVPKLLRVDEAAQK
jgi:uncharacterized membrane protein YgaE (UPF0421/DUF939 family)